MPRASIILLSLPHLRRPPVDALATAANLQTFNLQSFHTRRILQPVMACHTTSVGSLVGNQLQHWGQKVCNALRFFFLEVYVSKTSDILITSASTPFGTQNHFGRSILSRLNVVGKVVVDPASIAQICNLDADNVEGVRIFRLALVTCRGRGVEGRWEWLTASDESPPTSPSVTIVLFLSSFGLNDALNNLLNVSNLDENVFWFEIGVNDTAFAMEDLEDHTHVGAMRSLVLKRIQKTDNVLATWVIGLGLNNLIEKLNLIDGGLGVVGGGANDLEGNMLAVGIVSGKPDG
ncbi:hypothetical protein HG531_009464 [Fusarium graminearum]|nr:hypothetical protein HG531_009464 [Fusarium graminearum]